MSLDDLLTFCAGDFVDLMQALNRLERFLSYPNSHNKSRQELQLYINNLIRIESECEQIGLSASAMQAVRAKVHWDQNFPDHEVAQHIRELLSRVRDELSGVCFYAVLPNKESVILRQARLPKLARPPNARLRLPFEYFGGKITRQFPAIHTDLREAIKCYAFECFPACVYHLMRATEIGIPKIASLCGIKDPKPSWGKVLEQAETLTQKTRFEDLSPNVKPHIEFLRMIVADMRSLQRSWRNKVSHIEDRLILENELVDAPDAHQILVATGTFLRTLAEGLPETTL
ncbi:MAG: hypothetical protein ACKV2U_12680 [Bryobacteraceae bacterium]